MIRRTSALREHRWIAVNAYWESYPFIADWRCDRIVVAGWRFPRSGSGLIDLLERRFDRPIYVTVGETIDYYVACFDRSDAVRVKLRWF